MNLKKLQDHPLSLHAFKKMDQIAINDYSIPIELLMENAGLQLARRIAKKASLKDAIIVGAGNGNNGGGGLVAARRLAGWGFHVFIDIPVDISKPLPSKQLQRAQLFGVKTGVPETAQIWVDAYLGFSQRSPLSQSIRHSILKANQSNLYRISLDLPTGIVSNKSGEMFQADEVVTLAAHKKILKQLPSSTKIFLADIGIPAKVYEQFNLHPPNFKNDQIIPV